MVAAGVAGVCCVGLIAVVVVSSGRSTAPGAVVSGPAVGQAVRDGGFEFIVAGVHCGVKQVGDSSLGRAAAGQYCLATMTVHNVGGRPARFSAGEQVAGSADGDRYHPDAAAGLEANDNSQILDSEIDPGQQIQAIVVYDVPVTARLTKLILHESARSRGVTVNLPG